MKAITPRDRPGFPGVTSQSFGERRAGRMVPAAMEVGREVTASGSKRTSRPRTPARVRSMIV